MAKLVSHMAKLVSHVAKSLSHVAKDSPQQQIGIFTNNSYFNNGLENSTKNSYSTTNWNIQQRIGKIQQKFTFQPRIRYTIQVSANLGTKFCLRAADFVTQNHTN